MKKGDVYRHFKGGVYSYFGIVIPKTENHEQADTTHRGLTAIYEPTGEVIKLERPLFTQSYISDIDEPCVLYKDTKDGQLWARPIEDFCGWVMEDGYPSIKRFKLVEAK